MIKPGTILQDRYFVGKQIGSGGMGAVYLAIDHRFESQVAIKETYYNDQALSGAFEREARLLNSLHHPALPHVSDYFTEDDAHFLVMEHIEGGDLAEILQSGKTLPAADVLHWANQLLDALDYLHSQNPPIIHRDIKPHNLKITPRGDIILLDFGLAKLETADEQDERSIFGYSRTYSPLEQIEGTGTDARADIFSLAATGYHLLTGRPPVSALSRHTAIAAGKIDPLEPASTYNPEITPALDDILRTALAIAPGERFGSAPAMRTALEYAINESLAPAVEPVIDESPADDAPLIVPIVERSEEPAIPAFATVFDPAQTSEDVRSADETPIETAKTDRRSQHPMPFFVPVLDGRMASGYRRLAPLAVILFVLASGLIVWSFTAPASSSNEQAQIPVSQTPSTEQTPAAPATPDISAAVAPAEIETETPELDEAELTPEKKTKAERQNSSLLSSVERKTVDPPKKSPAKPEPPAPIIAAPKQTIPVKSPAPKTAPKPNIASTKVIIVPSPALTRPRVISKRPASKSGESSASEINRFMIGKP